MSKRVSVSGTDYEELGETGDDGSIHEFWALTREQILELAALDQADRMILWRLSRDV